MTTALSVPGRYGLPAVIGVERVTCPIRDGQRVRFHNTDGFVDLLS